METACRLTSCEAACGGRGNPPLANSSLQMATYPIAGLYALYAYLLHFMLSNAVRTADFSNDCKNKVKGCYWSMYWYLT